MKVKLFQENADDMEGAIQAFFDAEKPSWCQSSVSMDERSGDVVVVLLYSKVVVDMSVSTGKRDKTPEFTGVESGPDCPKCERRMVKRARRADGNPFWGCSGYPDCHGVRAYEGPIEDDGLRHDEEAQDGVDPLDDGDDIPF